MIGDLTTGLVMLGLAAIGGVGHAFLAGGRPRKAGVAPPTTVATQEDRSGWVYFITAAKRTDAPIKVGMSKYDPTRERLPDLRTMSPFPLRIIYKMPVADRYEAEAQIHEELRTFRQHGEWFDRDATMMYISHLKGEV